VTIKTNLRTTATDHQGNIELRGNNQELAFSGVFNVGLIMGSQDDETRRLPVDDDQLPHLQTALNAITTDCLYSLAGIGALISIAGTEKALTSEEYYGIGLAIKNLTALIAENQDHREKIADDLDRRNTAKGDRS
jgi:hypothetical protein